MSTIKYDTAKANETKVNLNNLCTEYLKNLKEFKDTLIKLKDYWVGEDADLFMERLKKDYLEYEDFVNKIKYINNYLTLCDNELTNAINKTN